MGQVGEHFRLNSPCMGTLIQDGKKIVFQIPAGSHIFAIDPIPQGLSKDLLRRVNIQWQGRTMTMFLTDLRNGGNVFKLLENRSGFPKRCMFANTD